jgi:hypothetical protein
LTSVRADATKRELCLRDIGAGELACNRAIANLANSNPSKADLETRVKLNLAFFLACHVYVTGTDSSDMIAQEAIQLVSGVIPADLDGGRKVRLEAQETLAWVVLWCSGDHLKRIAAKARVIEVDAQIPD